MPLHIPDRLLQYTQYGDALDKHSESAVGTAVGELWVLLNPMLCFCFLGFLRCQSASRWLITYKALNAMKLQIFVGLAPWDYVFHHQLLPPPKSEPARKACYGTHPLKSSTWLDQEESLFCCRVKLHPLRNQTVPDPVGLSQDSEDKALFPGLGIRASVGACKLIFLKYCIYTDDCFVVFISRADCLFILCFYCSFSGP